MRGKYNTEAVFEVNKIFLNNSNVKLQIILQLFTGIVFSIFISKTY